MNVYGVIVSLQVKIGEAEIGQAEIYDEDGVYYGLSKLRDNQRWKIGDADSKTCLGYFCSRDDALRIQACLQNDINVVNGSVTVDVVEYDMDVLELYQTVQIELDKFYSESCVNDGEKFSVDEAIRFLSADQ